MDKIPKYSGWIETVCGPMFSGKTEELINRITRVKISGKSVAILKPKTDDRYSKEYIVSHNQRKIKCIIIDKPIDIITITKDIEVVGIDEIQFFDNSIVNICIELANNGKRVIACGLDKDYAAKPFGPIPLLLAESEYVTKLSSICIQCGDLGSFSKRITKEKNQVVLGESDKYEATCRRCYYKEEK